LLTAGEHMGSLLQGTYHPERKHVKPFSWVVASSGPKVISKKFDSTVLIYKI